MLILVDFQDKSLHRLIEEVNQRLSAYGFDSSCDLIPADAIACALDEVRIFSDQESYARLLNRVEAAFARRRAQSLAHGTRQNA